MAAATTDTLKVPGATLYYEVRGSGPVLLMIPGGPVDAGIFTALADRLAGHYTVVTYDPRGNSRSVLDGPPQDFPVAVHADDASALLAAFGSEPAYVFGSSGGATIGLELVTRHPEQLDTFVGHEPPVMQILPDAARWRERFLEIQATYRAEGPFAGIQKFGEAVEEGGPRSSRPEGEPTPEQAEFMGRMMGNFDFFLAHVILPIALHVPDIDALRAASTRIVIGAGEESGEQPAYRSAIALAEKLGIEATSFPGGHGGFDSDTEVFADRLLNALGGRE